MLAVFDARACKQVKTLLGSDQISFIHLFGSYQLLAASRASPELSCHRNKRVETLTLTFWWISRIWTTLWKSRKVPEQAVKGAIADYCSGVHLFSNKIFFRLKKE